MVELWQANAAGRYFHPIDPRDAPLDPNFVGNGRVLTDADGRYAFFTIKPGAYPVPGRMPGGGRRMCISRVLGPASLSRLVTQMYFPGDPLNAARPHPECGAGRGGAGAAGGAAISAGRGRPAAGSATGIDIVLRGRAATPALP